MTKIEEILAKYRTIHNSNCQAMCRDTVIAIIREACEEQKIWCADTCATESNHIQYNILNCPNIVDQ